MEGNDPEIVSVFFDEAQGYIESLNDGLLHLESDLESFKRDKSKIDALFRAFHSIKGASGMLGFDRVNRLTHKSENLLEAVRSDKIDLSPEVVQALFEALDSLNVLLQELRTNEEACDLERILKILDHALEGSSKDAKPETPSPEMMKYLPMFLDETQDAIQAMESRLIEIESRVDKGDLNLSEEEINVLFRSAHQVKGSAAAIGFRRFSDLMHGVEAILDGFRRKTLGLSPEIMEVLLAALSTIKEMQQMVRERGADDVDAGAVSGKISSILRRGEMPIIGHHAQNQDCSPAAPANEKQGWEISFMVAENDPAPGVRAFLIASKASVLGAVLRTVPTLEQMADAPTGTIYQLTLSSDRTEQDIVAIFAGEGAQNVKCHHPLRRATDESTAPTAAGNKAVQTMRVDVERLDRLMNMSAEMVVNRARFIQIDSELRDVLDQVEVRGKVQNIRQSIAQVGKDDANASQERLQGMLKELDELEGALVRLDHGKAVYLNFQDAMQQSDLVSTEIQKAIMDIRMVPIGPLFGRFKRVVRDIAKENDKEVELVIGGEDTEIDKKLIDELADPLTHLVRNCVDHGVESPEVRLQKGKESRGRVTLNAYQKGNKICITISDDGKGIDCGAIRRKAVEKGICDEAGAASMSDHDAIQLIFHPGFSTAQKVTNISGRGVGMDIVKRKLEELRGSIEIQTVAGKGSEFVLLLPLTLAIQKSLICEVNSTIFAIPLENVLEIVHAKDQKTYFVEGDEFILLRDKVIPVKSMDGFFDGTAFRGECAEAKPTTLIVLFYKNIQMAVWVDRLVGQEDIVIRSFSRNLGEIAGLSGVTILGTGSVGLVLDAPGLLDLSSLEAGGEVSSPGVLDAAA